MNELSIFDSLFNNTMDNVLGGVSCRTAFTPKVDVTESNNAYNLSMDLPGRTENDVDIQIDHNTLTISSKKEDVKEKEKEEKKEAKNETKWLIRERYVSSFSRSFTLPDDVDTENVSAEFKNGILSVTMPRKALAAPKRIAIKCA
ncbi:MAG: Hsp20/alpha crystallin family protein [Treponema sp.]|nr:Hsp20/alpha crystallin family protein [Treponema sp.]